MLYRIHKQKRQPDIDDTGQRQQDTGNGTDRPRRLSQTMGEKDPQQRQKEQNYG